MLGTKMPCVVGLALIYRHALWICAEQRVSGALGSKVSRTFVSFLCRRTPAERSVFGDIVTVCCQ